ncbi:MAG: ornithine carbamoyltransferase [Ignavibacteriaceae bacterium]
MGINLKGKSLISINDLSLEEINEILKLSRELNDKLNKNIPHKLLEGKTLGMIFSKPYTRTRVSFQTGIYQLGGLGMYFGQGELQLGKSESIEDTAKVLSRYLNGIMIRTFSHQDVIDLAEYGSIPVINGLTDLLHPCQVLADLFTILEKKNRLEGLKLAYVGDGNNMAHSLLYGCSKTRMHISIASPKGYMPKEEIVNNARKNAAVSDCEISVVNPELVKHAKKDYIFMHCLPAHRGDEVVNEVADSKNSVIFDEAENRLHVQKAIMALLMGN